MVTWASLFERGAMVETDIEEIRETLATHRDSARDGNDDHEEINGRIDGLDRPDATPARVVADADVLAADLLVGGRTREALDHLRRHSWTALVASDPLLDDAQAVIEQIADGDLASDWRTRIVAWREPVSHPVGDHPALASAYHGGAMHVLSFDERLTSARAGVSLTGRFDVSVRPPDAFAAIFDPERLYPTVVGGAYPGPDRDPRS